MKKKILSTLIICLLCVQSAFALTLSEITDNAILLTKREPNYGRFTIERPNWFTTTIQFLPFELESLEREFKLVVNNAYNKTISGNTWFMQQMNDINNQWITIALSWSAWPTDRAKALLWSNTFKNFINVWNNPNTNIPTTNPWIQQPTQPISPPQNRTFKPIEEYTTINWKSYTIRQSNDGFYWYRQWTWLFFRTKNDCINYIEKQNRIIYIAPNWRKYGIFKSWSRYYFNRDEWSISSLSWVSIDDVKAYINQHNQPVQWCTSAQLRSCY